MQQHPPVWSLETIYPSITSKEFLDDVASLPELVAQCDRHLGDAQAFDRDTEQWIRDLIAVHDLTAARYESLAAYAYARFSTATQDETAVATLNRIEEAGLPLKALEVRLLNTIAERWRAISAVLEESEELAPFTFVFHEMREQQTHLMSPAEESLAEDLERSGGEAWSRLQEAISSTADEVWDEATGERKTVIALRSLAYHPDRETRRKAYEAELKVWKRYEIPLAFSINGVKGSSITLNTRRAYADAIDKSVAQSRITRKTLDALISSLEQALPLFRRYLKAKARFLGVEQAAFYDIFAPMAQGDDATDWTYEAAKDYIVERFTAFHPRMGAFAQMAFDNDWVDALPRSGKVGGAYCTGFPQHRESRVLANFDGSFSSVTTLAHELGHAYHGYILKDTSQLIADYPMTLAETASIFAEAVVFQGSLQDPRITEGTRIAVLEAYLQKANQVIVDILSRFYFERDLFARRKEGELMPADLCELMLDAQRKTYGDALDPEALHPYMWAVKGHYYRPSLAYYNFPYAFGQLFGLGLYAKYQEQGEPFREIYDRLLEMTGRASAVEVTRSAGFDIETEAFWMSGIAIIEEYVTEFEAASLRS